MKDSIVFRLISIGLFIIVSSCSSLSERSSLFGESEQEKAKLKNPGDTVPREQYDQLAKKYQELVAKTSSVTKPKAKSTKDIISDLKASSSKKPKSDINPYELEETVDVFAEKPKKQKVMNKPLNEKEVQSHIETYRKAKSFLAQNKFDQTMQELKKIENSNVDQVRVRVKFLLGEVLFKQEEYDLAMQIFEELITQDAFSGVVLSGLGRLIVCSEKLKLAKKQEQYYSLLHDFFEKG